MKKASIVAVALLLLSACASASGSGPNADGFAAFPAANPSSKIAGTYRGRLSFGALKGPASMKLSQSGKAIGGYIKTTFSSAKVTQAVSLRETVTNSLEGTSVATIAGIACTFSVTATYHPATATEPTLDGRYHAISGCSGKKGDFTMTQTCYFHSNATRPNVFPKPC